MGRCRAGRDASFQDWRAQRRRLSESDRLCAIRTRSRETSRRRVRPAPNPEGRVACFFDARCIARLARPAKALMASRSSDARSSLILKEAAEGMPIGEVRRNPRPARRQSTDGEEDAPHAPVDWSLWRPEQGVRRRPLDIFGGGLDADHPCDSARMQPVRRIEIARARRTSCGPVRARRPRGPFRPLAAPRGHIPPPLRSRR